MYINIYYNSNIQRNEFLNEFVIYNIYKRSFVKYRLLFKPFNSLINTNYLLAYKNNTIFYLLFDSDIYEFKVTKNGIEELFSCKLNGKHNKNVKNHIKFQNKKLYIILNNYLYIYKLKT